MARRPRWVLGLLCVVLGGCTPQGDPAIGPEGFSETFETNKLSEHWNNTGGNYRVRDGWLHVRGAKNKPLWLRRTLPHDVRIEVDVRSESSEGDIKLEVFGDGQSKAIQDSYTATSYVIIFGGWNNSTNLIARMDEHGDDRVVGAKRKVEVGRTYRMRIERKGETIQAWVDDAPLAAMTDPDPLYGPGHDHFAFNNWKSDLWFDNLRIEPL
jgi:hypothetical protein